MTNTHIHTPRGVPYRPKAVLEIFRLGLHRETEREKSPLNRGASNPLLPLPWLQDTQMQARLFSAH